MLFAFGVMTIVCILLNIFMVLVFVRVILSWFPPTGGMFDAVQHWMFQATEWAFAPLRKVLPPVRLGSAALDLSPLVLLLGITVLRGVLRC